MCYDPRKLDNKNYIYVLCLCSIKELVTLILVSLEHWNPWFVLETTGEAHQLFFCLIDCQCLIFHRPLVDAAHISPPVQFVWPTCLFLSYALLNVIICSTIQPFYFHPPSDGLVYPSCKFHVVIWVSYPLNHLFLAVSLSSCQPPLPPPVLLSSWHQTITLVLHPYSSLLPPPSKTLVPPLMKPKVSSTEAPETTHNYNTVLWSFEHEHVNHVLSTHFLDDCLYLRSLLLVKALGWDFIPREKINLRLPFQLLACSSLRSWSMHLTSFILIFSVIFVWHLVVLCVVGYRYLFRYFTHNCQSFL